MLVVVLNDWVIETKLADAASSTSTILAKSERLARMREALCELQMPRKLTRWAEPLNRCHSATAVQVAVGLRCRRRYFLDGRGEDQGGGY